MKPKYKLIGSSPSLDGIKVLIGRWLYSDSITLEAQADGSCRVFNGSKLLDGARVIVKRGRVRFEVEVSNEAV